MHTSFVRRHAQQFYWTVTRAVGLAHLHDGSRVARPEALERIHLLPVSRRSTSLPKRPRILFDMTGTAFHDIVSGIPRFVREIGRAAQEAGDAVPVVLRDGRYWTIYEEPAARRAVDLEPNDVVFIPDVHHQHLAAYHALMPELRARNGRLVVFVHDVIPLSHPATCYRGLPDAFARWFAFVAEHADAVITMCRAAGDAVEAALDLRSSRKIPIGWVPGASSLQASASPPSPALRTALESGPCFLMVGTMEPRKGHALALDAFDRLWADGVDATLLIIGHPGWGTRHVERRIVQHPRFAKSLFWFRDADDGDLAHAYSNCAALLVPSIVEGFGLPLVEAAAFGAHRIASDLAVFREVADGDDVTFFPVCDAIGLASAVARVRSRTARTVRRPDPRGWDLTSRHLFAMISEDGYQRQAMTSAGPSARA